MQIGREKNPESLETNKIKHPHVIPEIFYLESTSDQGSPLKPTKTTSQNRINNRAVKLALAYNVSLVTSC